MEELEKYLDNRLALIVESRELVGGDREETRSIMTELAGHIANFRRKVQEQKEELAAWRCQLANAARCLKLIETSKERVSDCSGKIPPHMLKQPSPVVAKPPETDDPGRAEKPKLSLPQVSCLTLTEYNSIPKYMKGRAQYDTLNTAVEEINIAIRNKYTFLSKPFSSISSLADKKKWKMLKSQDNQDTKGVRFITADDLKQSPLLKSETNRRNLLTILRHFQRIREVRGPGSIVRYVAIKKS